MAKKRQKEEESKMRVDNAYQMQHEKEMEIAARLREKTQRVN